MPLAAFPKCFLDALCVTREMTVDQWIDMSARFDVDGLEFYWGFTPAEDAKEWDRLRKRVEAQKRSIPMMCFSPDFTKPTLEERKQEIELQKKAIRATVGLDGKFCC